MKGGTKIMFEQPAGTFAITEQGDLGLGLTPIDEAAVKKDKDDKRKDDKRKDKKESESWDSIEK